MLTNEKYLTRKHQAERYARSVRTIERWGYDDGLGYPPEIDINGHFLRRLSDLERWERERAALAAANRALLRKQRTGHSAVSEPRRFPSEGKACTPSQTRRTRKRMLRDEVAL